LAPVFTETKIHTHTIRKNTAAKIQPTTAIFPVGFQGIITPTTTTQNPKHRTVRQILPHVVISGGASRHNLTRKEL
jgi:hypothetical protein